MKQSHLVGRYVLHAHPLELRDGNRLVDLTTRQLRVLSMLVEAGGKIVPKQAFFDRIWEGANVDDGNLTQTIFLLRRTLGQLPDGQEYIQTVSRKGYRLTSKALLIESRDEPAILTSGVASEFQSGDHFRMLVNSVEDYAIYMLDCAGRIVTWNPGANRILGYRDREILGQHYSALFIPEEFGLELPRRHLTVAMREGRWAGEGWRLKRNGARFWASSVLTAMRNSTGVLVGFGEVLRDLSERKRTEDALLRMESSLRKERDRLRAAAESSMDALYICEAVRDQSGEVEDFVFTYLNSNVAKMIALPREHMLGGRMRELLPAHEALGLFEAYKRVLLSGEPFCKDVQIQEHRVCSAWLRIRAVRLEDGVAVTASDLAERPHAERPRPAPEPHFGETGVHRNGTALRGQL